MILCDWEGNRRTGSALAMLYRLQSTNHYALRAYEMEISTVSTLQWNKAPFAYHLAVPLESITMKNL